jgi:hypothetical protein
VVSTLEMPDLRLTTQQAQRLFGLTRTRDWKAGHLGPGRYACRAWLRTGMPAGTYEVHESRGLDASGLISILAADVERFDCREEVFGIELPTLV